MERLPAVRSSGPAAGLAGRGTRPRRGPGGLVVRAQHRADPPVRGPGGGGLGLAPPVGDGSSHHRRQGRQPVRQRPGRPPASRRRTVRGDTRDRGAFRRRGPRRQRSARGDGRPVDQHRRGQHSSNGAEEGGRTQRQSPGFGEAASARPADSHRVTRGDRTAVAPACRKRVPPGEAGVSDHSIPGQAGHRLCHQASRCDGIDECGEGAARLHVRDARPLRGLGQPVPRQAAFRDPAHTGGKGGGTDAGVAGKAVARQLQRRGGSAHPARP